MFPVSNQSHFRNAVNNDSEISYTSLIKEKSIDEQLDTVDYFLNDKTHTVSTWLVNGNISTG